MDDGGDDRGAVAAVAAVDILHHLLAPRMFEIDVDVGRLQPLLGDEALEQQIDLGRIDRGDAEHVADGGVRRRAPALAQDVLAARIMDDVVHGEEIMRVFELGDQREFFAQGGAQRLADLAAEIFVDAGPGQVFQMLLRGLARRHRLVRILVFELVERKAECGRQSAWSPRSPRAYRGTAAPFRGPVSGNARHWPRAAGRWRRSSSSRGYRSARPAAGGGRDGGTAPRWSPAAALLPRAPGDAAAPAGACRRRGKAGLRQARRHRRGCSSGAPEFSAPPPRRSDAAAPAPEAGLRRIPAGHRTSDGIRPFRSA